MDHAKSTAKLSEASKNSSNKLYYQHKRGLDAENLVRNHLEKRGYKVLYQRLRTAFGEIDLFVESPRTGLVLLEVKNLGRMDWIEQRIHWKQLVRLLRLQSFMESKFDQQVSLWAAFVMGNEIRFMALEDRGSN